MTDVNPLTAEDQRIMTERVPTCGAESSYRIADRCAHADMLRDMKRGPITVRAIWIRPADSLVCPLDKVALHIEREGREPDAFGIYRGGYLVQEIPAFPEHQHVIVCGSYGEVLIDRDGWPIGIVPDEYADITRFAVDEWRRYYGATELPQTLDVVDVSFFSAIHGYQHAPR